MSEPRDPGEVVPFLAVTYAAAEPREVVGEFGLVSFCSAEYSLDNLTDYYRPEMGTGLRKKVYFLNRLILPEEIVSLKLKAFEIENRLKEGGKRTVNIDPGYVDTPKVVLASFKNFSHRIYLRDGVYAEVTLIYSREKKSYAELPWTYPDYKDSRLLADFARARGLLHH